LLFVCFIAIIRHLGSELPPLQAAFIRYALGLLVLAPVFVRSGWRPLYSRQISRHALRGCAHAVAVMLWFYAAAYLPLAEITALSFVTPIFVVIGAAVFLREALSRQRSVAIALSFIGVLVILRPGYSAIGFGTLAILLAAPLFATSKLLTKTLVRYDSSATVVVYLSIFATLTMLIPALFVWQTPTSLQLFWLAGTAVFATLSHLCITQGLRWVDVTVAQPIEFLQLVWSTLLGFFLFAETPSLWVWLGAAVIVTSASYIARYEVSGPARPAEPQQ